MSTVAARGSAIGQALPRDEDIRFLRGTAMYLDDIELPASALHVAFVRSRYAHANVLSVDLSAALAIPGVARVFTSDDIGDAFLPTPESFGPMTITGAAHPVFAGMRVRYVNQVIAAVVATSRAIAEDGADAVDVNYEALDTILDVRDAQSSSVRLHEDVPDNVYMRGVLGSGDPDEAFRTADCCISQAFHIPRVAMTPMETRGAIASWDRGTETLTLWASAQDVHRPRAHIGHALHIPQDKIHVILPDVGGAFGQKQVFTSEFVAVAFAAMKLGRTIKWTEDRFENFTSAPQGRGLDADMELALTSHGRILAIRGTLYGDMGAFSFVNGQIAAHTAATLLAGVYRIPNAKIEVRGVATNKVPTNPYRGAGRPEAALILEQLIDAAARELRMDPIELRRGNLVQPEALPYQTALGISLDSGNFPELLRRVVEMAELSKLRDAQTLARLENRVVGIGAAFYVERTGGAWESAAASIEPDGRIVARTGSSSQGQGHETAFAQVAADALNVSPRDVTLRWRDSGDVPRGMGTFASRSMTMGGNALHQALLNVRHKTNQLAAHLLHAVADDLVWEGGYVRAPGGASMSLSDLAKASYDAARVPRGFELGLYCTGHFSAVPAFTVGAHIVSLEIDRRTGRIALGTLFALDDAGRIVNPLLAEGQVIGASAQGIGEALCEEVAYDDSGRQLSTTFLDYNLITAADMPLIVSEFMETPTPLNPLGIKGLGEGGCCGAPAAIANAIADALVHCGAPPIDMPFTEEKLWRALHATVPS